LTNPSLQFTFANASTFNQSLKDWDVSLITNMRQTFADATSFNQDITMWDVGNVLNMDAMFRKAIAFNQDISKWDFNLEVSLSAGFLTYAGLDPENYSNLLIALAAKDWTGRSKSKSLSAENVKYNTDGVDSRA